MTHIMKVNISGMTPQQILVKEAFRRTIPSDNPTTHITGDFLTQADYGRDPLKYNILSQADFLRELDVASHKINSLKYYPNPLRMDEDGTTYAKIKSRVAIGFQERILTKRLTTLIGNNITFKLANPKATSKDEDMLAIFREGWAVKNMEVAWFEAVKSDGSTGDCAINAYMDNGIFGWRCFSFAKGDILYPHYSPTTGKLSLFGRRYSQRGDDGKAVVEYLDVWDNKHYMRYKKYKQGLKGAANKVKDAFGLDGYVVDIEPKVHGFNRIPIRYHRYGEPWWSNSQDLIDNYELAMSQLCENNAAYALRILYALGEVLEIKMDTSGTPTQINSPDVNAKVGFLEPADSSKSFELQLNTLEKNIMRCSFAVETPEIKSGADMSSLTVKMLFADSYQKALLDAQEYQEFIDGIVELFKYGYGMELGKPSDFELLKVKAEIIPYIFMSETEQVSNLVQLKSVGAISQQTAAENAYELGIAVNSEITRLKTEEHDKLVNESAMKTSATPSVNIDQNPINAARK